MPKIGSTPFQRHKEKWENCTRCLLHEGRSKVVLVRGTLPCAVLFVGEAPGVSEDMLGEPFRGPAGKLLDEMIDKALENDSVQRSDWNATAGLDTMREEKKPITLAFTNVVGCIPKGDDGTKTAEPPKAAIKACAPRLEEIIRIAKPELIVRVGKLADEHVAAHDIRQVSIPHPAFILRLREKGQGGGEAQQVMVIKRTVLTLTDAFEGL